MGDCWDYNVAKDIRRRGREWAKKQGLKKKPRKKLPSKAEKEDRIKLARLRDEPYWDGDPEPTPREPRKALDGKLIHPMRPFVVLQLRGTGRRHEVRSRMAQIVVVETDGVTIPLGLSKHYKGFRKVHFYKQVDVHGLWETAHYAISLCNHLNLCHQIRNGWAALPERVWLDETNLNRRKDLVLAVKSGERNAQERKGNQSTTSAKRI